MTRKEVSLVLGGLGSLEWPKSEQKEGKRRKKEEEVKEGVLFCLSLILLILQLRFNSARGPILILIMAELTSSANVIGVYRNMLRLVRRMNPDAKKLETLALIQKEFRSNALEQDPGRVATLLGKANSTIGYLKIISPKSSTSGQTGRTKIVFGSDGTKGSKKKVVSNWSSSNPDPDSVARHYSQLKRAGFTDNKSVIGSLF